MRVTVHPDLSAAEVPKRIPKQYKLSPLPTLPSVGRYRLVVVGTGDDVLRLITLKRALAKAHVDLDAPEGGTVVVCGYDFTQEAREEIARVGGLTCSRRNFGWTDERYAAVHESLSNRER